MNYHNIKKDDMNNGDGLRVTLFVSGCEHNCFNCQNPQTHPYDSGKHFGANEINEILEELDKDYISGITLTGGDPLATNNLTDIKKLVSIIKNRHPKKTIWVYTGYEYEKLSTERLEVLEMCDILVDGKYIESLRDVELKWRGSSNQRVIDLKRTTPEEIVLHCN